MELQITDRFSFMRFLSWVKSPNPIKMKELMYTDRTIADGGDSNILSQHLPYSQLELPIPN